MMLAQRLKDIRIKQKLRLKDVAKKSNMTLNYVSMLENGKRKITVKNKEKLFYALGIKEHDIMFYTTPKEVLIDMKIEVDSILKQIQKNKNKTDGLSWIN